MSFYSSEFFIFTAITVILYYSLPVRLATGVLVLASCYFYMTYSPLYIGLMGLSAGIGYGSAIWLSSCPDSPSRKRRLLFAVISNALLLFVFKYFNFFNGVAADMARRSGFTYTIPNLTAELPIGISFYVFLVIAYVIDVYRKTIAPERNILKFALFVSYFPKILAGPIERAKGFLSQIDRPRKLDWSEITQGVKLIVWGLFKKLVLADRLGLFVDTVYRDPSSHNGMSLALAVFFYSFQIYADFSGYTDIAIGTSKVFGIKLMDNFNRPYSATSISDFWRRWHVSLSAWLRDYLYIPLGGNRVTVARRYYNVLIVFFVCGLWHGANWTFIVWGLVHGLFIVCSDLSRRVREGFCTLTGINRLPVVHRVIKIIVTFILASLAWVFFRAASIGDAFYVITHLFSGWDPHTFASSLLLGHAAVHLYVAAGSLVLMWVVHFLEAHENMRSFLSGKPLWLRWSLYYVLVLALLLLGMQDSGSFIYFQF